MTRDSIADFVSALIQVYTLLIFAYIVSQLVLQFVRPSYSRPLDAVLGFLRDVCEPYLSIFRRFIPAIGPFDLSPIVAIFVLRIVGGIVVNLIRG